MGKRLRAGIDLDGVLYPWSDTARWILKEYLGIEVTPSESWDHIKNALARVDSDAWRWLWNEGITAGMFSEGSPYQGGVEAMEALEKFADIVIITARPKSATFDTLRWLADYRIPVREVVIVGPTENKAHAILPCDFYVDDKVENCADLHAAGRLVFLWDQPWNQTGPGGVHRVFDWTEVLSIAGTLGE